MKLELRKFKSAEFASEETLCFSADVYIDGVKAGYAKNDGHGGCTSIHAYPGMTLRLDRFEAWAKTLPKVRTKYEESPGKPFEIQPNAEYLIDTEAGRMHSAKQLRSKLKTRLVIRVGKDHFRELKPNKGVPVTEPRLRELVKREFPGAVVLNDEPFEKALDLYTEE